MYTDPDGREITREESMTLMAAGGYTLARLDADRLCVITSWTGDPYTPWVTRAWLDGGPIFGRHLGSHWAATRAEATADFERSARLIAATDLLPAPHHSRSDSDATASHVTESDSECQPTSCVA